MPTYSENGKNSYTAAVAVVKGNILKFSGSTDAAGLPTVTPTTAATDAAIAAKRIQRSRPAGKRNSADECDTASKPTNAYPNDSPQTANADRFPFIPTGACCGGIALCVMARLVGSIATSGLPFHELHEQRSEQGDGYGLEDDAVEALLGEVLLKLDVGGDDVDG